MSAVTTMQEQMHAWACEDEQEGELTQRVGEVLGPQQEAGDDEQDRACNKGA